ncbi:hypothetical protein [Streptomyces lichenis]|uniref:Uncharacterized protein n=1 Tax=Streptomyces lichenis TaxID=2306967 RepID=A0ABT0I9J0_9ACTN|nr:hypothetical protein [Streptomyces lichenis]MCK8677986.1 hypothetical protein [Streptomyces lichenis]
MPYRLHDDLVTSVSALRRALSAAGIGCPSPSLDEDERTEGAHVTSIRYLGGPDAARMADVLAAGQRDRPADRSRTADPAAVVYPSLDRAVAARKALHGVLAEMGVGGLSGVEISGRTQRPVMHLEHLDHGGITRLVSALRADIRPYDHAAKALEKAVRAAELDDFPVPDVNGLRIRLGHVSVATAARLATLLGADPLPGDLAEVPDWPEADAVMDRLVATVKEVTDGGFMDAQLHPNCEMCGHLPTIELGDLSHEVATGLAEALRRSASDQLRITGEA